MFKNKKNLRFIKEQMEKETPNMPDSLNEENIKKLLDEPKIYVSKGEPLIEKRHIKIRTKAIISFASCIAIIISALAINFSMGNKINVAEKDIISTKNSDYADKEESDNHPFKDYNELVECFNKMQDDLKVPLDFGADYNTAALSEETAKSDGTSTGGSYSGDVKSSYYETTYKQVENVDEGDIIKNDGKYIYIANSKRDIKDYNLNKVYVDIYEADNGTTKLVSQIKDFQPKKSYSSIYDLYLYNDKLVIIFDGTKENDSYAKTNAIIYDISDRTSPKKIKSFSQDGDYISSRIVGNNLYLISNKYIDLFDKYYLVLEDCIPKYKDGEETEKKISINDVYCVKDPKEPNYVVASSIDLDNSDKFTDTKAVLGAGEDIYCNEENLYVLCTNYGEYSDYTEIMKFSINNGIIKFKTSNKVKGTIDNQYSVDEKDGNLRIATTYYDEKGNYYNALFILDENLKEIGKVKGFAKGETIQAVRYIGDMAYVITYEQTDPLFIIDLSNPKKPEIKGSVKISGFSSILHPIDENTLLGVGYSTESTDWGESENGIKIALFDISDSTNPKVLDSKVIKNYSSEAQENPKALVVNNDKGYFAMPISEDSSIGSGAQIFTVENGKINLTQYIKINDPDLFTAERCTYIDDYLYIIRTNDSLNYGIEDGIEGHKVN